MSVISVDAGTTMIKAVGYDGDGVESCVVRQETTLARRQAGWVEQDMAEVWNAVVHAVRTVVAELDEPPDYLALTAQGDGCWLVDNLGRPTGPAILWNDGRAAAIVEQWRSDGLLEDAFRVNGSMGFAGLPHAILTWLRRYNPDRLRRSSAALTCGGWLFSKLTGRVGVDSSDAAAPFVDPRTGEYSTMLLQRFDMAWARSLLPEILDGRRRVAELSAVAAAQLGVPEGTAVVLSSYDIASTSVGCGAVEPGQACSILGTTLCTEMVIDSAALDAALAGPPAGLTIPLGVPDRMLRALPTLAGGEVIQWACRMLGLDSPGDLGELAREVPPGAGGLSFLPYLSPAGERAPFLNDAARGSLMGLSFEHTRSHVARAVLEGLTLVIADCLATSTVAPTELRVCGGGAASATWCQLIADITGVPTSRSSDSEIGARGAMVLGATYTRASPDVSSAVGRYVTVRDTFAPDAEAHAEYTELYRDFLALREIAGEGWPRLARMRTRAPSLTSAGPIPALRPAELAREEGYRVRPNQQTVTHPTQPDRRAP
ncbi:FGGY-family carbohydrate kinase [Pseudonocardia spinosispora]|uniref:FGGY-family carbohydrate kinase n=1 Tax=Pseudonocardia spinosispora TaxID=103441 RepID=UPI000404E38E|nr:FGGY-family carbohydrate kinase [Pseudonocardia spinosispora]